MLPLQRLERHYVANVVVMALHLQTATIPTQIHSSTSTVILDVTDINTKEYYLLLHFYDWQEILSLPCPLPFTSNFSHANYRRFIWLTFYMLNVPILTLIQNVMQFAHSSEHLMLSLFVHLQSCYQHSSFWQLSLWILVFLIPRRIKQYINIIPFLLTVTSITEP